MSKDKNLPCEIKLIVKHLDERKNYTLDIIVPKIVLDDIVDIIKNWRNRYLFTCNEVLDFELYERGIVNNKSDKLSKKDSSDEKKES